MLPNILCIYNLIASKIWECYGTLSSIGLFKSQMHVIKIGSNFKYLLIRSNFSIYKFFSTYKLINPLFWSCWLMKAESISWFSCLKKVDGWVMDPWISLSRATTEIHVKVDNIIHGNHFRFRKILYCLCDFWFGK